MSKYTASILYRELLSGKYTGSTLNASLINYSKSDFKYLISKYKFYKNLIDNTTVKNAIVNSKTARDLLVRSKHVTLSSQLVHENNTLFADSSWVWQKSPADNSWLSVCYGNGLFVAVAISGTGNRVMTSPDGITWTIRTSADNNWWSVCYGNGLFVAVADTGTGNRVMTSPDGITWTIRTSAADNNWRSVCYGNGLFVAVADTGIGNRVMTMLGDQL